MERRNSRAQSCPGDSEKKGEQKSLFASFRDAVLDVVTPSWISMRSPPPGTRPNVGTRESGHQLSSSSSHVRRLSQSDSSLCENSPPRTLDFPSSGLSQGVSMQSGPLGGSPGYEFPQASVSHSYVSQGLSPAGISSDQSYLQPQQKSSGSTPINSGFNQHGTSADSKNPGFSQSGTPLGLGRTPKGQDYVQPSSSRGGTPFPPPAAVPPRTEFTSSLLPLNRLADKSDSVMAQDDTASQRSHSSQSTSGCSSMAPQINNKELNRDPSKRRRESGENSVETQTPPPQPDAKRPRLHVNISSVSHSHNTTHDTQNMTWTEIHRRRMDDTPIRDRQPHFKPHLLGSPLGSLQNASSPFSSRSRSEDGRLMSDYYPGPTTYMGRYNYRDEDCQRMIDSLSAPGKIRSRSEQRGFSRGLNQADKKKSQWPFPITVIFRPKFRPLSPEKKVQVLREKLKDFFDTLSQARTPMNWPYPVKVIPRPKVKPLHPEQQGEPVISETARKIMAVLDGMKTPISDAKKIPVIVPDYWPTTKFGQEKSRTIGPPTRGLQVGGLADVVPNRQVYGKGPLSSSQLGSGRSSQPGPSGIQSSRDRTGQSGHQASGLQDANNQALLASGGRDDRERQAGERARRRLPEPSSLRSAPTIPITGNGPFNLPPVDFTLTSSPSGNRLLFNFSSPTATNQRSPVSSGAFQFSQPIHLEEATGQPATNRTTGTNTQPTTAGFSFSSPIKQGSPGADTNTSQALMSGSVSNMGMTFKTADKTASLRDMLNNNSEQGFSFKPAESSKQSSILDKLGNSGSKLSKPYQKPNTNSATNKLVNSDSGFSFRPAEQLKQGSVMDILGGSGFKPAEKLKSGSVMDVLGKSDSGFSFKPADQLSQGSVMDVLGISGSGFKPASELKQGSVMDILGGKTNQETSTTDLQKTTRPKTDTTTSTTDLAGPKSAATSMTRLKPVHEETSKSATSLATGTQSTAITSITSTVAQSDQTKQPSLASLFKVASGTWECEICLVQNKPDAVQCLACQTPRPGGKDSKVKVNDNKQPSLASMFKVASGTWECEMCLVQNKPDTTQCAACQSPRPGGKVKTTDSSKFGSNSSSFSAAAVPKPASNTSSQGLGSVFKPPSGTWSCLVCLIQNKPEATKCAACQTPKPEKKPALKPLVAEPSSGWTCEICLVPNKADATVCIACQTKKPAKPYEHPPGDWECDTCKFMNKESAVRCCNCEYIRPGPPRTQCVPSCVKTYLDARNKERFGETTTVTSSSTSENTVLSGTSGTITSSGFKFGGTSSTDSTSATGGFKFGDSVLGSESKSLGAGFKVGSASESQSLGSGFVFGSNTSSEKTHTTGIKFGTTVTSASWGTGLQFSGAKSSKTPESAFQTTSVYSVTQPKGLQIQFGNTSSTTAISAGPSVTTSSEVSSQTSVATTVSIQSSAPTTAPLSFNFGAGAMKDFKLPTSSITTAVSQAGFPMSNIGGFNFSTNKTNTTTVNSAQSSVCSAATIGGFTFSTKSSTGTTEPSASTGDKPKTSDATPAPAPTGGFNFTQAQSAPAAPVFGSFGAAQKPAEATSQQLKPAENTAPGFGAGGFSFNTGTSEPAKPSPFGAFSSTPKPAETAAPAATGFGGFTFKPAGTEAPKTGFSFPTAQGQTMSFGQQSAAKRTVDDDTSGESAAKKAPMFNFGTSSNTSTSLQMPGSSNDLKSDGRQKSQCHFEKLMKRTFTWMKQNSLETTGKVVVTASGLPSTIESTSTSPAVLENSVNTRIEQSASARPPVVPAEIDCVSMFGRDTAGRFGVTTSGLPSTNGTSVSSPAVLNISVQSRVEQPATARPPLVPAETDCVSVFGRDSAGIFEVMSGLLSTNGTTFSSPAVWQNSMQTRVEQPATARPPLVPAETYCVSTFGRDTAGGFGVTRLGLMSLNGTSCSSPSVLENSVDTRIETATTRPPVVPVGTGIDFIFGRDVTQKVGVTTAGQVTASGMIYSSPATLENTKLVSTRQFAAARPTPVPVGTGSVFVFGREAIHKGWVTTAGTVSASGMPCSSPDKLKNTVQTSTAELAQTRPQLVQAGTGSVFVFGSDNIKKAGITSFGQIMSANGSVYSSATLENTLHTTIGQPTTTRSPLATAETGSVFVFGRDNSAIESKSSGPAGSTRSEPIKIQNLGDLLKIGSQATPRLESIQGSSSIRPISGQVKLSVIEASGSTILQNHRHFGPQDYPSAFQLADANSGTGRNTPDSQLSAMEEETSCHHGDFTGVSFNTVNSPKPQDTPMDISQTSAQQAVPGGNQNLLSSFGDLMKLTAQNFAMTPATEIVSIQNTHPASHVFVFGGSCQTGEKAKQNQQQHPTASNTATSFVPNLGDLMKSAPQNQQKTVISVAKPFAFGSTSIVNKSFAPESTQQSRPLFVFGSTSKPAENSAPKSICSQLKPLCDFGRAGKPAEMFTSESIQSRLHHVFGTTSKPTGSSGAESSQQPRLHQIFGSTSKPAETSVSECSHQSRPLFVFGSTSNPAENYTSCPESSQGSRPLFVFGRTSKPEETSNGSRPLLDFGITSKPKGISDSESSQLSRPPFVFGSTSKPAENSTLSPDQSRPLFVFGSTVKPLEISAPESSNQSRPPFVFGSTSKPEGISGPESTRQSRPLFDFGSKSKPAKSFLESSRQSRPLFVFGSTSQPSRSFGPEISQQSPLFVFGNTSKPSESSALDSSNQSRPLFVFGSTSKPAESSAPESSQQSKSLFVFGSTSKPAESSSPDSTQTKPLFVFGSTSKQGSFRQSDSQPAPQTGATNLMNLGDLMKFGSSDRKALSPGGYPAPGISGLGSSYTPSGPAFPHDHMLPMATGASFRMAYGFYYEAMEEDIEKSNSSYGSMQASSYDEADLRVYGCESDTSSSSASSRSRDSSRHSLDDHSMSSIRPKSSRSSQSSGQSSASSRSSSCSPSRSDTKPLRLQSKSKGESQSACQSRSSSSEHSRSSSDSSGKSSRNSSREGSKSRRGSRSGSSSSSNSRSSSPGRSETPDSRKPSRSRSSHRSDSVDSRLSRGQSMTKDCKTVTDNVALDILSESSGSNAVKESEKSGNTETEMPNTFSQKTNMTASVFGGSKDFTQGGESSPVYPSRAGMGLFGCFDPLSRSRNKSGPVGDGILAPSQLGIAGTQEISCSTSAGETDKQPALAPDVIVFTGKTEQDKPSSHHTKVKQTPASSITGAQNLMPSLGELMKNRTVSNPVSKPPETTATNEVKPKNLMPVLGELMKGGMQHTTDKSQTSTTSMPEPSKTRTTKLLQSLEDLLEAGLPDIAKTPSQATSQGPNVTQKPSQGPNVAQELKGANVAQEPLQGPTVAQEPSEGPNVAQETSQGLSVAQEPSQGPNVTEEPSHRPNIAQRHSEGPNVAQEPSQGPNVAQKPSQGPNVAQEPSQGPNVAQEPSQGPNVAHEPAERPDFAQKPPQGPRVAEEPSKGQTVLQEPSTGLEIPLEPSQKPAVGEETSQEPSVAPESSPGPRDSETANIQAFSAGSQKSELTLESPINAAESLLRLGLDTAETGGVSILQRSDLQGRMKLVSNGIEATEIISDMSDMMVAKGNTHTTQAEKISIVNIPDSIEEPPIAREVNGTAVNIPAISTAVQSPAASQVLLQQQFANIRPGTLPTSGVNAANGLSRILKAPPAPTPQMNILPAMINDTPAASQVNYLPTTSLPIVLQEAQKPVVNASVSNILQPEMKLEAQVVSEGLTVSVTPPSFGNVDRTGALGTQSGLNSASLQTPAVGTSNIVPAVQQAPTAQTRVTSVTLVQPLSAGNFGLNIQQATPQSSMNSGQVTVQGITNCIPPVSPTSVTMGVNNKPGVANNIPPAPPLPPFVTCKNTVSYGPPVSLSISTSGTWLSFSNFMPDAVKSGMECTSPTQEASRMSCISQSSPRKMAYSPQPSPVALMVMSPQSSPTKMAFSPQPSPATMTVSPQSSPKPGPSGIEVQMQDIPVITMPLNRRIFYPQQQSSPNFGVQNHILTPGLTCANPLPQSSVSSRAIPLPYIWRRTAGEFAIPLPTSLSGLDNSSSQKTSVASRSAGVQPPTFVQFGAQSTNSDSGGSEITSRSVLHATSSGNLHSSSAFLLNADMDAAECDQKFTQIQGQVRSGSPTKSPRKLGGVRFNPSTTRVEYPPCDYSQMEPLIPMTLCSEYASDASMADALDAIAAEPDEEALSPDGHFANFFRREMERKKRERDRAKRGLKGPKKTKRKRSPPPPGLPSPPRSRSPSPVNWRTHSPPALSKRMCLKSAPPSRMGLAPERNSSEQPNSSYGGKHSRISESAVKSRSVDFYSLSSDLFFSESDSMISQPAIRVRPHSPEPSTSSEMPRIKRCCRTDSKEALRPTPTPSDVSTSTASYVSLEQSQSETRVSRKQKSFQPTRPSHMFKRKPVTQDNKHTENIEPSLSGLAAESEMSRELKGKSEEDTFISQKAPSRPPLLQMLKRKSALLGKSVEMRPDTEPLVKIPDQLPMHKTPFTCMVRKKSSVQAFMDQMRRDRREKVKEEKHKRKMEKKSLSSSAKLESTGSASASSSSSSHTTESCESVSVLQAWARLKIASASAVSISTPPANSASSSSSSTSSSTTSVASDADLNTNQNAILCPTVSYSVAPASTSNSNQNDNTAGFAFGSQASTTPAAPFVFGAQQPTQTPTPAAPAPTVPATFNFSTTPNLNFTAAAAPSPGFAFSASPASADSSKRVVKKAVRRLKR